MTAPSLARARPSDLGAATRQLQHAVRTLRAHISSLPALPLPLVSVQPASSLVRQTAVYPPTPHPLAQADPVRHAQSAAKAMRARGLPPVDWASKAGAHAVVAQAVEVVLEFESSVKVRGAALWGAAGGACCVRVRAPSPGRLARAPRCRAPPTRSGPKTRTPSSS